MPLTLTDSDGGSGSRSGTTNFPSYLHQNAPIGALKDVQGNLDSFYDTQGLESSYKDFNSGIQDRGLATNALAARAAQSRAELSGGRVGSSFAQGSANQALFGQLSSNMLDMNRQRAALMAQKGQLAAGIASDITGAKQRQQGMLADYDIRNQGLGIQRQGIGLQQQGLNLDKERMDQQNEQFQQSLGLQRSGLGLQALQYLPNGQNIGYSLNSGGQPNSAADNQNYYRAQNQQATYSNMLQQVLNGVFGG